MPPGVMQIEAAFAELQRIVDMCRRIPVGRAFRPGRAEYLLILIAIVRYAVHIVAGCRRGVVRPALVGAVLQEDVVDPRWRRQLRTPRLDSEGEGERAILISVEPLARASSRSMTSQCHGLYRRLRYFCHPPDG